MKIVLFCAILVAPFPAPGEEVLMQWDFEKIANKKCIEPLTGIADTIEGM